MKMTKRKLSKTEKNNIKTQKKLATKKFKKAFAKQIKLENELRKTRKEITTLTKFKKKLDKLEKSDYV